MNKTLKKVFIAISCVCVAIIIVGVSVVAYIEIGVKNRNPKFLSLIIERSESAYEKDPSVENLHVLCENLLVSGEHEKVQKYCGKYIFAPEYQIERNTEAEKKSHDIYLTAYLNATYYLVDKEEFKKEIELHFNDYLIPAVKYQIMTFFYENALYEADYTDCIYIMEELSILSQKYGDAMENFQAQFYLGEFREVVNGAEKRFLSRSTFPDLSQFDKDKVIAEESQYKLVKNQDFYLCAFYDTNGNVIGQKALVQQPKIKKLENGLIQFIVRPTNEKKMQWGFYFDPQGNRLSSAFSCIYDEKDGKVLFADRNTIYTVNIFDNPANRVGTLLTDTSYEGNITDYITSAEFSDDLTKAIITYNDGSNVQKSAEITLSTANPNE